MRLRNYWEAFTRRIIMLKKKIRQQLQLLRDRGFIEFIDNRGHYIKTNIDN